MVNRWAKLKKDFKLRNNKFDISKIPDIYDCIKYDLLHNQQLARLHTLLVHTFAVSFTITFDLFHRRLQLKNAEPLYSTVRNLADIVIPQVRRKMIPILCVTLLSCFITRSMDCSAKRSWTFLSESAATCCARFDLTCTTH